MPRPRPRASPAGRWSSSRCGGTRSCAPRSDACRRGPRRLGRARCPALPPRRWNSTGRLATLCAAADPRPPRGILEGVSGLEERGWIADQTADALSDGYAWLRRAEHVLQLADGTPDVRMPRTREAQTALARRMGYRDPEGERARRRMLADADRARERVGEAMARLSADAGAASPRTRRYHPAGLAGGER